MSDNNERPQSLGEDIANSISHGFGVVWGLAVLGITVEVLRIRHREAVAITLYVTMGWLALIAIYPLVQHIPAGGLLLLLAGGLAYTVEIVFYVYERVPYAHLVWHLFVLAGTTFHFFAVLNYPN